MKRTILIVLLTIFFFGFRGGEKKTEQPAGINPPIYIAFLWHMHQPIYWPYENVMQTQAAARYSYSVVDIFNQRIGPYTTWPKNAVQKGIDAGLGHLGAQVSFSGSLIENLNNLEAGGDGNFSNWKASWKDIRSKTTSLGNPRLDMVGFGYFHPLMGLIDQTDIQKQIEMHKTMLINNFGGTYSKGMFPPENAFSERMIPALAAEGIEWILVDDMHFDRTAANYPFSTSGNIYEPNKADQVNPDPNDWVQLTNLWAPTKNSARWGRQPHYAEYVDPSTGVKSKIVVVPADRYLGNEDGRGGFGALQYESVMSQLEPYNTDPNHPILIVLHHDGDNYGGGSDSYYNSNFQAFVNWLQANPSRFVCTTIQDYLQMFPVDQNDVIHVEDGSWAGADNGDPEFKKWLGDPDASTGYSPDRNSWGVITAAKNLVLTANQIDPNNSNTQTAWKYLLVGESSDYWYWDNSQNGIWDSHPTRAANQAITAAQQVTGTDLTPPTIFLPQREPYNPGGTEWGINQSSDLTVWSYVFDKSGLASVSLKYRIDSVSAASPNPLDYKIYAGGPLTGAWKSVAMTGVDKPSKTDPAPLLKAKEYSAQITGLKNKLIDYYIEATDNANNTAKSPIRHCWIGANAGSNGGGSQQVSWSPAAGLTKNDTITITVTKAAAAKLHWGVNDNGSAWTLPDTAYWPAGTSRFSLSDPSVETPFSGPDTAGTIKVKIGPFNKGKQVVDRIAFVIHYNDNTWDNNSNNNYHIQIDSSGSNGNGTQSFVMDGILDSTACQKAASNKNADLWIGWNGKEVYVATQAAQTQGNDVFIFVSDSARAISTAPWAKAGKVAGYSAMLANESTNNYAAWTSVNGAASCKAGAAILEGTLNVQNEFGYIPSKLYIAVGQYGTADNGTLQKQIPAGNGDANIDPNELFAYSYTLTTEVKNTVNTVKPLLFSLSQNYPNPFNPSTIINYEIPANGKVILKVYDVLGHEVKTLVNEEQSVGVHFAQFDAKNCASGVYYYTLRFNGSVQAKKMIVLK